jgi:hypothetical protein
LWFNLNIKRQFERFKLPFIVVKWIYKLKEAPMFKVKLIV